MNIYSEESPTQVLKCIELISSLFKIKVEEKILERISNLKYSIGLGRNLLNEEVKIICIISDFTRENIVGKTISKSRPDFYVEYENEKWYIEYTKTGYSDSGNNLQYQRFSKFPLISSENRCMIMDNNDSLEKIKRNLNVIQAWKYCGVNLLHTNSEINNYIKNLEVGEFSPIIIFKNSSKKQISDFIKEVNNEIYISVNIHKSCKNKLNNTVEIKECGHDPGIGQLLLILNSIIEYCIKNKMEREIIIDCGINHILFKKQNKLIGAIKCLASKYPIYNKFDEIINLIENIEPADIIPKECNSEKVVGIYEEFRNKDILFTNHASGELSKIEFNGKSYNYPNLKLKPDLIVKEEDSIILVEAEKYENQMEGINQIKDWRLIKEELIKIDKRFSELKFYVKLILYCNKKIEKISWLDNCVEYLIKLEGEPVKNPDFKLREIE